MSIDNFLSRLDKVRQTAAERWIAICPAHDDRTPSLSICEGEDGRVLINCFAGCQAIDVIHAVGLEFADLFPEKIQYHSKRQRYPFNPRDVLRIMTREALVVSIAASQIATGKEMLAEDVERILLASERLHKAAELANGEF
jgi:DNA primase